MTGAEVTGGDFEEAALEPHLRANLRLLDADGRSVLAESRDLDEMRARFGARARDAFAARASEGLAQGGLTEFPAEPIPESVPGPGGGQASLAHPEPGHSVSHDGHDDPD